MLCSNSYMTTMRRSTSLLLMMDFKSGSSSDSRRLNTFLGDNRLAKTPILRIFNKHILCVLTMHHFRQSAAETSAPLFTNYNASSSLPANKICSERAESLKGRRRPFRYTKVVYVFTDNTALNHHTILYPPTLPLTSNRTSDLVSLMQCYF